MRRSDKCIRTLCRTGMELPLIGENETFALIAVLMTLVGFGLWAETTRIGSKFSAPLVIIVGAMLLSNFKIIPNTAPAFTTITSLLVPLAIPLLLFRADLKKVVAEAGPVLMAFFIATVVTIAGAFAGAYLIDLGAQEHKIVGTLAASYIGGGVNYVATAQTVQLQDPALYFATLSADTVGAVLFLTLLMVFPTIAVVRRFVPSEIMDNSGNMKGTEPISQGEEITESFDLGGATNAIALSLLICAVGKWLSEMLDMETFFILTITLMALLVANFSRPLVRRIKSDFELGTLFMYMFFATIGAGADMGVVFQTALPILFFILVMVAVHMSLLLVMGRLLKLDLAKLLIASNACILGPASAAAMAASLGWRSLVTPGMLVGILGYAVATFIGVGITGILAG